MSLKRPTEEEGLPLPPAKRHRTTPAPAEPGPDIFSTFLALGDAPELVLAMFPRRGGPWPHLLTHLSPWELLHAPVAKQWADIRSCLALALVSKGALAAWKPRLQPFLWAFMKRMHWKWIPLPGPGPIDFLPMASTLLKSMAFPFTPETRALARAAGHLPWRGPYLHADTFYDVSFHSALYFGNAAAIPPPDRAPSRDWATILPLDQFERSLEAKHPHGALEAPHILRFLLDHFILASGSKDAMVAICQYTPRLEWDVLWPRAALPIIAHCLSKTNGLYADDVKIHIQKAGWNPDGRVVPYLTSLLDYWAMLGIHRRCERYLLPIE